MKTIKIISISIFLSMSYFIVRGAPVKVFDLQKEAIDLCSFPLNVSSVIDARENRESIGIVRKGLLNRRVSAQFKLPLEEGLLSFLRSNLDCSGVEIMVMVNKLWVYEKIYCKLPQKLDNLKID